MEKESQFQIGFGIFASFKHHISFVNSYHSMFDLFQNVSIELKEKSQTIDRNVKWQVNEYSYAVQENK